MTYVVPELLPACLFFITAFFLATRILILFIYGQQHVKVGTVNTEWPKPIRIFPPVFLAEAAEVHWEEEIGRGKRRQIPEKFKKNIFY